MSKLKSLGDVEGEKHGHESSVSRRLSGLSIASALAFALLAASAQNAPTMGGGMKGEDAKKGCDMMGGDRTHMTHMMPLMREKLSHAGDRVAALKTDLKITESQMPAWNKFADARLASAKSMEASIDAMHKRMHSGAASTLQKSSNTMRKLPPRILPICRQSTPRSIRSTPLQRRKLTDGLKFGPMGVM